MCAPIGPFRMMTRETTKIELLPVNGVIVMLFEDLFRGLMRTIYTKRGHPEKQEFKWMGDSVGRWEGDTPAVDPTGFNDRTWLNDAGAQDSDALHLVERVPAGPERKIPGIPDDRGRPQGFSQALYLHAVVRKTENRDHAGFLRGRGITASSGVMRTLSALSIFRISLRSDRVLKVEAEPWAPARPVRPTRCTKSSGTCGKS